MNRKHQSLLLILVVSLTTYTCMDNPKKTNKTEQEIETKQQEYIYDPGPEWSLDWSDEFESDTLNEKYWNYQVEEAGRFNEEWQRYTNSSQNAYIENNCLVIKAIHESNIHGHDQYTSARLNTANKLSWQYGKIAARIKLPQGKGIWPAFWMLGANIDENGGDTPWPQSGEIDIMELFGTHGNNVIEANVHYADENGLHAMMGAVPFTLEQGNFADDFHVFELEWDAHRIAWLVDGEPFASISITDDIFSEFHNEFFILLNLAIGGTYAGRPDRTTTFPQYMYVDWVRVYKK